MGSNGFGTRTFWTVAVPDSDVSVNSAAGKAEMRVDNLSQPDYGTKFNSLGPNWQTAFDPGVVSFDVVWSPPITRRLSVLNGTLGNNYAGQYVENQVTVTWSGTNLATGFTFTANPGTLATSSVDGGFAELGQERNGIFLGDRASSSAGGGAPVGPSVLSNTSPLVVVLGQPGLASGVAPANLNATTGPADVLFSSPAPVNAAVGALSSGQAHSGLPGTQTLTDGDLLDVFGRDNLNIPL